MRTGFSFALAWLLIATSAPAALAAPNGAGATPPPPAVVVTKVQVENVAPSYDFIGRVQAVKTVQLMARVTAFLEARDFTEGGDVKQGQVLFQLQKAPFEAAVQSAKAQLDKAQATLVQAEAAFQRSLKLNKQGFEAQSNLDQARATRDSNVADVEAAKANLATAAINLSYCTIVAPISGRIGASTFHVGSLVTPSSQPLATINEMDPVHVAFAVADRNLVSVQQRNNADPTQIAQQLSVSLKLSNGTPYDQTGKISFIDNQVDPSTGTITVWADFANPQRLLVPGGFVTVEVRRAQPEEKPMIPVASAQTDQSGSYVLVVGPDNKVKQQPVKLGRQVAQNFIVDQGLTGGEQVIVQGMQKVQPGEVVKAVVEPGASETSQAGAVAQQGG